MAITNEYQPSNVRLRIVKGNGLAELDVQEWDISRFQPTTDITRAAHGLHAGLERDKLVLVNDKLAALGCRGDRIVVEFDTVATGTTTWAMLRNGIFLDMLDLTAVSIKVQHGLYAKYSKFPVKVEALVEEDAMGIDTQKIEMVHNVACTVDGTAKVQKIRGVPDSRITATATGATTAVTLLQMIMTPKPDGVFVIPRLARIWAGSGTPT